MLNRNMPKKQFSINFDYRCPFARNVNEHVINALRHGADYEVSFKGFSLNRVHVEDGGLSVFDDPNEKENLLAVAAGIVVRDKLPDSFYDAHLELFAARHDHAQDLRSESVIRSALERAKIDSEYVFKELEEGWPYDEFRFEHESSVTEHQVFGVPTFIVDDAAVFVRLMTRGTHVSGEDSVKTIDNVISLIVDHTEINEFKYTSISR